MTRTDAVKRSQFKYWNLRRKGVTQAKMARMLGISRQAVSKAVKLQSAEVLSGLLEFAGSAGVVVEWTDTQRGLLVGSNPQLGHTACIVLMDDKGRIRTFYDQSRSRDAGVKRKVMADLRTALKESMVVYMEPRASFKEIVETVMGD